MKRHIPIRHVLFCLPDCHLTNLQTVALAYHPMREGKDIIMADKDNPRNRNGSLRRKYRARFKAMGAPCGICHGTLGEIHYDEPSDAKHPLSFVIDEILPISRAKEFGYESRRQAAEDWNNLQAAHYICNLNKSNKTMAELEHMKANGNKKMVSIVSADW